MKRNNLLHIITATTFLILLLLLVLFPNNSFNAAKNGLYIWLNNVLPALLPFFFGSEILIGLGVIHFIGILLEPIMQPIFNVPGIGSFIYTMSITSGYPMGTKIVSELRNRNLYSKEEGQRLLSLCSTSGPLFIIGSVSIGMFKNPYLGGLIAISHYLGSIATGLTFRNYGNDRLRDLSWESSKKQGPFQALYQARIEDGRKLGILLGDAARNSINTLLIIGSFIIFFSVLTELLSIINFFELFCLFLSPLLSIFNVSEELIKGLLSGILEITNGANIISKTSDPLLIKGIFTSFIIAWGGFSIHAQAISFISKTDLRIMPYLLGKLIHGIYSSILFYILLRLLIELDIPTPVFNHYIQPFISYSWLNLLFLGSILFLSTISTLIFTGLLVLIVNKNRILHK